MKPIIKCSECEWNFPDDSSGDCKRYGCSQYGQRECHYKIITPGMAAKIVDESKE